MKRTLALLALLFGACSVTDVPLPLTVIVTPEQEQNLSRVQEAVAAWNEAAPGVVRRVALGGKGDSCGRVYVVTLPDEECGRLGIVGRERIHQGDCHSTLGLCHHDDPNELRVTIEHELGHAMGLGHSDDPESIMWGDTRGAAVKHITAIDAEEVRGRM